MKSVYFSAAELKLLNDASTANIQKAGTNPKAKLGRQEGGEEKMFREGDDRHYESPKVTECVALRTTSEACLPEKRPS